MRSLIADISAFRHFSKGRNILKRASREYSKLRKNWEHVIGLEVHAQISSESKLFSGASTNFNVPVNRNVSLFDCATPGTLPVLNKRCVEAGILTALALNCKINPVSMFDRKHYFYADLPAGYQITQQRMPLAQNGILNVPIYAPGQQIKSYITKARLKQLQLEQDSGKSLHDNDRSLVDLNRAGIPLMELVFEPDLRSAEEAASLVKELVLILRRLGTCSCKMEEGELRVDVNVSVNRIGEPLGVRSETKNVGSIRGVFGAVSYEIDRQISLLEKGEVVVNGTRAWDAANKKTLPMRDKEQQQDYRYMPEPNLPPLHVALDPIQYGCVNVYDLKENIPEMPEETRTKLVDKIGLTMDQAVVLVNEESLMNIFNESAISEKINAQLLANILINDFLSETHKLKINLDDLNVKIDHIQELVLLLQEQTINRKTAKLIISEIVQGNKMSPREVVEKNNWVQITDENELTALCQAVLVENEKLVELYKAGKQKVFKALLGSVFNKSSGRADMIKCTVILKNMLNKK